MHLEGLAPSEIKQSWKDTQRVIPLDTESKIVKFMDLKVWSGGFQG